ncbi:hypothetical protein Bca4012_053351 [Brassica carinata]|uniref:Uncharacterized protein n=1 Tax=Brassica carinata TaxID=52824 RepID=A0A8X7VYQ0_BRACI|nr:hypothetical protein Bca52824_013514 [Brassica carinata]
MRVEKSYSELGKVKMGQGVKYVEQELKKKREHPELYKDRGPQADGQGPKPSSSSNNYAADSGKSRQAATDQIMLERLRKRERNRVMRRHLIL